MSGFYSAGLFNAIPDSVVNRTDDDANSGRDERNGIVISTTANWGNIQARISSQTSGLTTAYILDPSDGSVLASKDVSSLTAGDVVTFDTELTSGSDYVFAGDAGGASYTGGYLNNAPFTIESADGKISMIDGWFDGAAGNANAWLYEDIGNINTG
jgi:hypothetical protein